MTDKINGRTPEEIKMGLECCKPVWKGDHWKDCDVHCPYIMEKGGFCKAQLYANALVYIHQLEQLIQDFTERTARLETANG